MAEPVPQEEVKKVQVRNSENKLNINYRNLSAVKFSNYVYYEQF